MNQRHESAWLIVSSRNSERAIRTPSPASAQVITSCSKTRPWHSQQLQPSSPLQAELPPVAHTAHESCTNRGQKQPHMCQVCCHPQPARGKLLRHQYRVKLSDLFVTAQPHNPRLPTSNAVSAHFYPFTRSGFEGELKSKLHGPTASCLWAGSPGITLEQGTTSSTRVPQAPRTSGSQGCGLKHRDPKPQALAHSWASSS